MAVIGFAAERPDSPKASFEVGKYTVTRKFLVLTSSVLDGPGVVALAIGLPRLFQPYIFGTEFLPNCRVRSVVPERIKPASLEWEVTVTYETPERKHGGGGEGGQEQQDSGTGEEQDGQFENPLLYIPEVETRFETYKQPIYGVRGLGFKAGVTNGSADVSVNPGVKFFQVGDPVCLTDITPRYFAFNGSVITSSIGKSIETTVTAISGSTVTLAKPWTGVTSTDPGATLFNLNFQPAHASNGEIFVPPPEMDASRLILTITRNEDISSPHPALALAYQDSLNSDIFWGAAPGQCKVMSITAQRQTKQLPDGSVVVYLRCTYQFQFRPFWDIQLLDKGNFYFAATSMADPTPARYAFQSREGQPIEGLLDGNGQKLADGGNPVFLSIRPYRSLPFAALNLPNSFLQVQ